MPRFAELSHRVRTVVTRCGRLDLNPVTHPPRMFTHLSRWLALCTGALCFATAALAQESSALLNALVRKGILTQQDAEEIRAEVVRETAGIPAQASAGGKSTERLSVGMRVQIQYAHLDTDLRGTADPAPTHQAFLRRMYLTLKAALGNGWGATVTYDFASNGYDDGFIEWRPSTDLAFNFGLRKVNTAYEERASSGNLKSIERSGVTRYFVEANNGRRLGAASYRIGAFVDGTRRLTKSVTLL
jgi:polyhydroxyalkanoate synthesis regulator phasin